MTNEPIHSRPASQRIVELDALRALAAINLMLFHFTHVYSVKYGYTTPLGFEWPYGKYGVQLFFMLSGLVNAMTLARIGQAGEFVVRRTIRILPAFYLVVALNLVWLTWMPLSAHGSYTWDQVLANLTLVPNLLGYECLEPVTWTLQIEVMFYGMLALLFAGGALRQPAKTMSWYLAICVCLHAFLTVGAAPVDPGRHGLAQFLGQLLLIEHGPLFVIGMMLYELKQRRGDWRANAGCLLAAALVFHAIDLRHHNPAVTVLLIGVLALAASGRLPLLRTRPLMFISTISYSLYLLHNNLGCVVIYHMNQLGIPSLACFALSLPIMVGLSAWASLAIEWPLSNRLRKAWQARRDRLAANGSAWSASAAAGGNP